MAQGDAGKAQRIVVQNKGWDPTRVFDTKTQSYGPPIDGFDEASVFTNQGVPASKGRFPQQADGYDVRSIGANEPKPDFNSPVRRSETNNAPFPGVKGDPFKGMPGGR